MTTLGKFAYAALLALATISLIPSAASAQGARGRFTLTHDVRWASTDVSAGEYEFAFDPVSNAQVLTLSELGGAHRGYILLVNATDSVKPARVSQLVIENRGNGRYVSAMQLSEIEMTLEFAPPSHNATRTRNSSLQSGQ